MDSDHTATLSLLPETLEAVRVALGASDHCIADAVDITDDGKERLRDCVRFVRNALEQYAMTVCAMQQGVIKGAMRLTPVETKKLAALHGAEEF